MRSDEGHRVYLDGCGLPKEDREIIAGFIEQRNAVKPTATRTKGKQAYECVWIAQNLSGAALSSCTVHDLLKAAGAASSGNYTKNSRQTKIMILKVLARYIHRFHHEIPNLDLLTQDVKAGTAESDTKDLITVDEWHRLINTPMPARDKAMVAMLYDGYHRPMEILILKWSDLKIQKDGSIQYVIKFKTGIPRTIVHIAIIEIIPNSCIDSTRYARKFFILHRFFHIISILWSEGKTHPSWYFLSDFSRHYL